MSRLGFSDKMGTRRCSRTTETAPFMVETMVRTLLPPLIMTLLVWFPSFALGQDPKRGEPLFLLAKLEVGSGNLGDAEMAANRALERDHSRVPQVYLLLAGIHQARHLEESSEVLKQLLQIRSDSVQDRDAWWRYLCRHPGRSDSMLSALREEVLQ